jgi:hypothetical protein
MGDYKYLGSGVIMSKLYQLGSERLSAAQSIAVRVVQERRKHPSPYERLE